MSELPAPLVSEDIDIRGMDQFMLDVHRLLASELVALGTPEECWAALMLWCRAWQQHPAGSLPNDERVLAAFSRAGSRWKKVREMALRGFVLCADGRLYHPVLASQVMTVWKKRQAYRGDQDRLKKWREEQRQKRQGAAALLAPETEVESLSNAAGETAGGVPHETGYGPEGETADDTADETHFKLVPDTPPERSANRNREGEGEKENPPLTPPFFSEGVSAALPDCAKTDPETGQIAVNGYLVERTAERVAEAARMRQPIDQATIIAWLRAGYDPDQLTEAVRRVAERPGYKPPRGARYFDRAVREIAPAEAAA